MSEGRIVYKYDLNARYGDRTRINCASFKYDNEINVSSNNTYHSYLLPFSRKLSLL